MQSPVQTFLSSRYYVSSKMDFPGEEEAAAKKKKYIETRIFHETRGYSYFRSQGRGFAPAAVNTRKVIRVHAHRKSA